MIKLLYSGFSFRRAKFYSQVSRDIWKSRFFKTSHVFRTTSPSCVFKVYIPNTIYLQNIYLELVETWSFSRNQIRDFAKPSRVLENLESIKTVTITWLKSQCSFVFIVAFYFCFGLLKMQLIKKSWKAWCGLSIFLFKYVIYMQS